MNSLNRIRFFLVVLVEFQCTSERTQTQAIEQFSSSIKVQKYCRPLSIKLFNFNAGKNDAQKWFSRIISPWKIYDIHRNFQVLFSLSLSIFFLLAGQFVWIELKYGTLLICIVSCVCVCVSRGKPGRRWLAPKSISFNKQIKMPFILCCTIESLSLSLDFSK